MRKTVIITGVDGEAGRCAAAYFRAKGFFVIGTDIRDKITAETDEYYHVPRPLEPSYIPAIVSIIRAKSTVLFLPTVTDELYAVARAKAEIEELGCCVFISSPEVLDVAGDKLKTARFLEARDIGVPRTLDGSAPMELVVKELGLPLLARPVLSGTEGESVVYISEDEVRGEKREGIVFQEFVPGDEFNVNLFMGEDGWAASAVALKKTAAGAERVVRPDVVELAVDASREIGLTGPLDIDIRLRAEGAPVLLEIRPRLGAHVRQAPEVLDSLLNSLKKGG